MQRRKSCVTLRSALWFLKSQINDFFEISPKLSEARDLPQTYRQTFRQTRPCNSKASITKSVVGPISRWAQRAWRPYSETRWMSVGRCKWSQRLTVCQSTQQQMKIRPLTALFRGKPVPCGFLLSTCSRRNTSADNWHRFLLHGEMSLLSRFQSAEVNLALLRLHCVPGMMIS